VDEGGDRRRAGHGVGQPDVERDLRALATSAEEEEEAERAEAEDEGPSASKSVYQRGMTRVPDRLELQHKALISPDGEK
jgi:hypothetical protein